MNRKNGISLMVLLITIVILSIITTITILGIENIVDKADREDFVVEITIIEDKIKEYYTLTGSLPVNANNQYLAGELEANVSEDLQYFLSNEIVENGDFNNVFYEVDMNKLELKTTERGLKNDDTDIYVVASNTLNVYYLKGVDMQGTTYFSKCLLVESNEVERNEENFQGEVSLNKDLNIVKSTNVWTNEITLFINSEVSSQQGLQYSIGGTTLKDLSGKKLVLNKDTMSENEKTAFSTNKFAIIVKYGTDGVSEIVNIPNLDIEAPVLGNVQSIDVSQTGYNILNIATSDTGGSGVKAIYYDYDEVLENNIIKRYYVDRTTVGANDLITFGKMSTTGNIKLEKNIKSIVAVVVDNAKNVSQVVKYTLQDEYVESR